MSKNVLKEIIIALLICLAIILLLALVLYEYVPSNKTLPEKVSYSTPSKVSQELVNSGGLDESEVIMTYELDSSDLKNYQRINKYNPGKTNPFASIGENENGTESSNNSSNSNNSSTNNNSNDGNNNNNTSNQNNSETSSGSSKESGYVQDKGTK